MFAGTLTIYSSCFAYGRHGVSPINNMLEFEYRRVSPVQLHVAFTLDGFQCRVVVVIGFGK